MHHRLLQLAQHSRVNLFITILSGLLIGALALGQAYVLSNIVSSVFILKQTLLQVWFWMQILLLVIVTRGILVWANEVAANEIAVRVKTDLRAQLFAHILALGPGYSRGERTGELTSTIVNGIEALDAYFSQFLPQLVISTLVPVSILIFVFRSDPLSGFVLLLTAPLIPLFMYLIGRSGEGITRRQFVTLGRFSAYFLDSLQGLTTLKLFGQSRAQVQNIARMSDQYRDATLKVLQVTFLSAFALELLATLGTAMIAVEVGLRLLYSQMLFQEALFILILAPEFYLPLRMLGMRFHASMNGTTSARRIFEILDIPDPMSNLQGGSSESRNSILQSQISNIELSNISYTYPGETRPALEAINLTISRGQHIALVGPSGSGKSTLAGLILRFIEPTVGLITVERASLADIPTEDWLAFIAWVPQTPYLFHDTLAANIRIGRPSASMQEVNAAAHAANLDEFIDTLPEKYDTVIGEGGARLSSGQAQRLALARAYLKDAPILILDEPTSSLDPELESFLEESTRRLMRDRTVITIAHRLNTVFNADRIYVLNAGRVVESGTHRELLANKGEYSRILNAGKHLIISGHPLTTYGVPAPIDFQPVIAPAESEPQVFNHRVSTFIRLMGFLSGSWRWIALSVLLGSLTIGSNVALMATSAWLISTAALHPSIAALEVAIVGVRFFGLSRAVFRYFERLVSHNVTFHLLGKIRVWFYARLEPLAPARLMDYRAGDLLARVIGDVATLENFYVRLVAPPLISSTVAIVAGLYLASIDARLTVIIIVFFTLLGVILPTIVLVLGNRSGIRMIDRRANLHSQLVDSIQGLPDLLAFGRSRDRLVQLQIVGEQYGNAQRTMSMINGIQSGIGIILTNVAMWLALLITIPLINMGSIEGVMLASLALLIWSVFEAVTPLPQAAQMLSATNTAAKRLFDIVESDPVVGTQTSSVDEEDIMVSQPYAPFSGMDALTGYVTPVNFARSPHFSIEFSNLTFNYPDQTTPALQNVSFQIASGQNLAIIGPSGAGKSTIASLLLRFWDYSSGDIYLDGRSLKSWSPDEVQSQIAYVSSGAYFFNTSIYDNLRMARKNVCREEIEQAAEKAQIHEFITHLPAGYETVLGERGVRLSGGERQRLAITRALIKNAPILILDEPTANLDQVMERRILETLFEVMQNKTSLLITHRLIGLENISRILVLDHGSVVECGTLNELLGSDGLFQRLWDLQHRIML